VSQENAELVKGTHEAVNRRDLDALLALYIPRLRFENYDDPREALEAAGLRE
jgi:hypothetical protein